MWKMKEKKIGTPGARRTPTNLLFTQTKVQSGRAC